MGGLILSYTLAVMAKMMDQPMFSDSRPCSIIRDLLVEYHQITPIESSLESGAQGLGLMPQGTLFAVAPRSLGQCECLLAPSVWVQHLYSMAKMGRPCAYP